MLTIGHSYSEKPTQKDDKYHIGTCGICGTDFEEEHYGMESDNTCDECGYKIESVTVKILFSEIASENGFATKTSTVLNDKSYTYKNITFSFKKGTGSNDIQYYKNGTNLRVYSGNTVTISAPSGKNMTKIVFTTSQGAFETKTGSMSTDSSTWTGSANSIEFTVSAKTFCTACEITYM